jgi:hypothetical protein
MSEALPLKLAISVAGLAVTTPSAGPQTETAISENPWQRQALPLRRAQLQQGRWILAGLLSY